MSKSGYIADELADRIARICERTRSEVLELLRTFTASWVSDCDSAATPIPYGDRKKSQGNDVGSSQL